MATERNKRLVFNILAFLDASVADGSIRADDAEGIEIASQCISEAFGVDLNKAEDKSKYSLGADSLASILEAHVTVAPAKAEAPAPATPVTPEIKAQAEKAKSTGNQKMAAKDYAGAISAYGDAIKLDGSNPVYWSNRAAAFSQQQAHQSAIDDARQAIELDPSFSKAYSRLGHALFSSGEFVDAVEAYEQGLAIDPTNATMKSSLATARSRVPSSSAHDDDDEADETSAVGAARGGLPAGFPGMGAGGMPNLGGMDFASMMSNPAIMQMAQQMMQGGGLEQMMQNPMIQQMMSGGGAGGMPDMAALMNDPMLRNMAAQMGGAMGRGPAEGSDGNDGPDTMYS